jgi:hypothetical protein
MTNEARPTALDSYEGLLLLSQNVDNGHSQARRVVEPGNDAWFRTTTASR